MTENSKAGYGCLTIILFLLIAFKACDDDKPKKIEEMNSEAYIIAKEFMSKTLKAPSTAKFPSSEYKFIASNKTNYCIIKSYVDAQNSFGAQIRTYYLVELKWNEQDWADANNWELIDLQTDENKF